MLYCKGCFNEKSAVWLNNENIGCKGLCERPVEKNHQTFWKKITRVKSKHSSPPHKKSLLPKVTPLTKTVSRCTDHGIVKYYKMFYL